MDKWQRPGGKIVGVPRREAILHLQVAGSCSAGGVERSACSSPWSKAEQVGAGSIAVAEQSTHGAAGTEAWQVLHRGHMPPLLPPPRSPQSSHSQAWEHVRITEERLQIPDAWALCPGILIYLLCGEAWATGFF